MTLNEIKDFLVDNGCDDAIVFENPDYANAFIGYSDEGRAIYSYNKMVKSLMEEDNITEEDAIDFIDYNTLRAIPYFGGKSPIILYDIY